MICFGLKGYSLLRPRGSLNMFGPAGGFAAAPSPSSIGCAAEVTGVLKGMLTLPLATMVLPTDGFGVLLAGPGEANRPDISDILGGGARILLSSSPSASALIHRFFLSSQTIYRGEKNKNQIMHSTKLLKLRSLLTDFRHHLLKGSCHQVASFDFWVVEQSCSKDLQTNCYLTECLMILTAACWQF